LEFEVKRNVVIQEKVEVKRKVVVNEQTQSMVEDLEPALAKQPKNTVLPHQVPTTNEDQTMASNERRANENVAKGKVMKETVVRQKKGKEKYNPTTSTIEKVAIPKEPKSATLPHLAPPAAEKKTMTTRETSAKEKLAKEGIMKEKSFKGKGPKEGVEPMKLATGEVGPSREPKGTALPRQPASNEQKTIVAKEGANEDVVKGEAVKEVRAQENAVEKSGVKGDVDPKESTVRLPKEPESTTLPYQAPTTDEKKTIVITELVEMERIVEKKIKMSVNERVVRVAEKDTARGQVRSHRYP
jgi:hypothetical protein